MKESINSSNDLIQSLQIIENHLQRIGKCIISIKRDGSYLPRAVFSGLGRKHSLKDLNIHKELIRLCIRERVNDNENLYCPWLSDSIESIQTQLKQYKKIKKKSLKYYGRICCASSKRLFGDYTHLLSMRERCSRNR